MGGVCVCTIAAKPEFALARVTMRSFLERHPDIPAFILLCDEPDGLIDAAAEPCRVLTLADLGRPETTSMRFRYNRQELTFACAPYLLGFLLDLGFSSALLFKQESLVLGDLRAALTEVADHAVTLTPHHLDPLSGPHASRDEQQTLISGVYNAGWVGVSDRPEGRAFVSWWQDRLFRDCRHDVAAGVHLDQRWLDLASGYFDDVKVLRDPGVNVAYWNLPHREIGEADGVLTARGRPVVFMRFSGFDYDAPERPTRYFERPAMADLGPAARFYEEYRRRLAEEGHEHARRQPYAYDRFSNGVAVPLLARRIYRDLGADAGRFGDPLDAEPEGGYFSWLNAPAGPEPDEGPQVSHLWKAVWDFRPGLQKAFPDPLGEDRRAFARWTVTSGLKEHAVDEAFRIA